MRAKVEEMIEEPEFDYEVTLRGRVTKITTKRRWFWFTKRIILELRIDEITKKRLNDALAKVDCKPYNDNIHRFDITKHDHQLSVDDVIHMVIGMRSLRTCIQNECPIQFEIVSVIVVDF